MGPPVKQKALPASKEAKQPVVNKGASVMPTLLMLVAAGAVALAAVTYKVVPRLRKNPVLQPLHAPKLTDLEQFTPDYKDKMLWGSYRSGLYFGMRTRSPKSLLAGLIWFDPDSPETIMQQRVRHYAFQGDGLQRYGWVRHDGRTWGRQVLVDGSYNITLTMVKHHGEHSGVGGDWAVRVHVGRSEAGEKLEASGASRKRISLLMYLADEDKPKVPWMLMNHGEPETLREPVNLMTGGNSVVGDFSFHVLDSGVSKKRPARLNYLALPAAEGDKDYKLHIPFLMLSIIYENMQRNPSSDVFHMELPNGAVTGADLAMFQLTVSVGSTTDWVFLSHSPGADLGDSELEQERVAALSGEALTRLIESKDREYEDRFRQVFPSASSEAPEHQEVAKAALSNLIGSMGYFYGSSKISLPGQEEPAQYWPAPLFTAVPSRSFFPRGFLWDEGFHQLLVQRWDPELSRDVIAHWLDLMNSQGWIPREQILGAEAEQRVPAEFVVQNPLHANPPSLFLPIANMAQQLVSGNGEDTEHVRTFLQAAWPRLETWYHWYNTTQQGPVPGSYRWRGRNASAINELNPKTLTSGLDDYPRASHPTDDERHLDLRCWMALVSHAMASIGRSIGLQGHAVDKYRQTAEWLSDPSQLSSLHWDSQKQQFLDWGLHTEAVRLTKANLGPPGESKETTFRVTDQPPRLQFVPHFGYVSLFPLLMRLLPPDSPQLGALLSQLRREDLLWTPHGLRSLSRDSSLYKKYNTEHDPPYWRGQIWFNINYLTLSALRHYATTTGPHQQTAAELETQLQAALTQAVVSQYQTRGYLYEQYDDSTGQGTSSHPFTGWTALIALVATGSY